ncbi:GlxA family transcriptional regulator [Nocardia bovistercoris]|uniref:GlxA family transcriptional regulator n=1 Tax=Nocardia bovistercoris TaxID=2785916 RepID=UPI002FCCDE85
MTISDQRVRTVVLLAYDDAEILDVTGPASVFAAANSTTGIEHYDVRVVAARDRVVFTGGLVMHAEPAAGMRRPVDTLMIAGGIGCLAARADHDLVERLRAMARRSRRVASVCSGTFVLAEAGLADGATVTTHWAAADFLAECYPAVTVEPDRIYVRDGRVWSSAGVTAGIDLTLALVAEDLGEALANDIARGLVLPVRRSGGQSQYSAQLAARVGSSPQLAALLSWMTLNLDADLSVAALAERVGWGERHFARRFRAETGSTPARHVEDLRIDAARHLLESTDLTTDAVAAGCGFGSREVMHRTFRRRLATTPTQYRRSFSPTG